MAEGEEYTFKGTVNRCIYDSDNFKVYAMNVSKKEYPEVKHNIYSNVGINGDIQQLSNEVEYDITAIEEVGKYGYSYKVINIKRDIPTSAEGVKLFLQEVLTPNQAEVLYNVYPDIVDRVKEDRLDDIDLDKLPGIKEKRFDVVVRNIANSTCIQDLVIEFKGVLSLSILQKIYSKYKSVATLRKKLNEKPYKTLTSISGIGFKSADDIVFKLQDNKIIDFGYDVRTSCDRCLACIAYFLEENENDGNTKADISEIRKKCIEFVPECANHFTSAIQDDDIYYNKNDMEMALKKTYDTEKYIANTISKRAKVTKNIWDFDIEKYRSNGDLELSDEQMVLLESVCKNQVTVLTAPAGCGKSFSTKSLISMLKDNQKTFILCSPTGKAAKKLSEYCGEVANTIHRTLGYVDGAYEHNEKSCLKADLVLIDEFGMTPVSLFASLLRSIDMNTKIVLIGDPFQLNSIGAGAILRDLLTCNTVSIVKLTKVFRLGIGGALTACTYVRQNKKFITKNEFTQLGEDKSYTFIPTNKNDINKSIVNLYTKLIKKFDANDITVISCYNIGASGCDKLNALLQPIANKNANKNNSNFLTTKRGMDSFSFYEGDSIIQNKNNYHAISRGGKVDVFIPNGTLGVIKNIDKINNTAIIDFDGVDIIYKKSDLIDIRHAFAISLYKFQGSQNKIIIFCCPSSHLFMLDNNTIYTALSRAEKLIFHFTDAKTLNIAMNKSSSKNRKTFLGDMLKELSEADDNNDSLQRDENVV